MGDYGKPFTDLLGSRAIQRDSGSAVELLEERGVIVRAVFLFPTLHQANQPLRAGAAAWIQILVLLCL